MNNNLYTWLLLSALIPSGKRKGFFYHFFNILGFLIFWGFIAILLLGHFTK